MSDACGAGATKVGFLYVGPKDDFGYNQAAYEAAVAMGEATGVEVIHAENVPETIEDAVPVMEDMIAQGATIFFPTSFGHFLPGVEIAKQHPDVCVVHQGQLESSLEDGPLDNLGTYFSSVFEPVYLAGIAAGRPPRPTRWVTSMRSRSPRRCRTSTPSRWVPRRSTPTSR